MDATLIDELPEHTSRRLFTVADLAALPDDLPTGPAYYELHDGELVIMAPPGSGHGRRQVMLASLLYVRAELTHLGKVFTETSVVLSRGPDVVLVPDVAFVLAASLPVRTSPEDYLETVPEIVAEVKSRNDSTIGLRRKAARYLAAGANVVWLLDPATRTVTAVRAGVPDVVFTDADTLADDLLPGFAVAVSDLFS